MENYVRQTNEQITCNWSSHARVSTMATCFEWSLKIAEFIIDINFNAAKGITKHLLQRSHLTADFLDVLWHWKAENVCDFIDIWDRYIYIYILTYWFYFLWNLPIELNARDLSEHLPYDLLWLMGMELHGSLHQTTLRFKDHYKRKNNQLPKYYCRHFQYKLYHSHVVSIILSMSSCELFRVDLFHPTVTRRPSLTRKLWRLRLIALRCQPGEWLLFCLGDVLWWWSILESSQYPVWVSCAH